MPITLQTYEAIQERPALQAKIDTMLRLLEKYDLAGWHIDNGPNISRNGDVSVVLHCMPVLPFFLDLSEAFGVPIDKITVDANLESGPGTYEANYYLEVVIRVHQ